MFDFERDDEEEYPIKSQTHDNDLLLLTSPASTHDQFLGFITYTSRAVAICLVGHKKYSMNMLRR